MRTRSEIASDANIHRDVLTEEDGRPCVASSVELSSAQPMPTDPNDTVIKALLAIKRQQTRTSFNWKDRQRDGLRWTIPI
ncbi:hypothetical protein [Rhizobium sp. CCGE 510]|uniref:hypothetical protein n=1 Tax=Rhizobium sp. CCGE 510 TaxID=1132836 RepID=UPI00027B9268|nr:hypothetical protein [Rhizobium sp. CCGE 510]EJT01129.1 hypothetical protein RCCGE510_32636 [Rhizobium sp. CCGE 510]